MIRVIGAGPIDNQPRKRAGNGSCAVLPDKRRDVDGMWSRRTWRRASRKRRGRRRQGEERGGERQRKEERVILQIA